MPRCEKERISSIRSGTSDLRGLLYLGHQPTGKPNAGESIADSGPATEVGSRFRPHGLSPPIEAFPNPNVPASLAPEFDALKFQTSAREWLGALFQIAKAPRRSLTRRRNSESDSAATMPPGQTPFQILFMSPIISGTGTMTGLASKGHGLRTGELVVPRRWKRGHTNPCRTSPCRWSHGRAAKDDERSRRHSRPT